MKSQNLTYEQATTLPINAATALKVVRQYLKPSPGKKILIHGATGGIGLFAVRYCKHAGAIVTGTVSSEKGLVELVKPGVDEVIYYHRTEITTTGKTWDAILDTSGKLDFSQAAVLLNENREFSTMAPHSDPLKSGRISGSKKENLVLANPGSEEFAGQTFSMCHAIDVIKKSENGKINIIGKVVLVNE